MSSPGHRSGLLDLAIVLMLPAIELILSMFAYLGFSGANFGETYVAGTCLLAAVLTFVFPYLRLRRIFVFPLWFIACIISTIYIYTFSLYFGFFQNFWWWDEFAHSFSSAMVTMIVFYALCFIAYFVHKVRMSSKVICYLTFAGGFSMGFFWELFESTVDWVFHNAYMSYTIVDSLCDIHMDFIGALAMSLICAVVLHRVTVEELVSGIDERGLITSVIHKHGKH